MSRVPTNNDGYIIEIQFRAFCWALDAVRRPGFVSRRNPGSCPDFFERELAITSVNGFAASEGQGWEATGSVLLRARKERWRQDRDAYSCHGPLMEALQQVVDADPFLVYDNLVLMPGKQELIFLGKAVEQTVWWKANADNIKKARRDLKKVREVHES